MSAILLKKENVYFKNKGGCECHLT